MWGKVIGNWESGEGGSRVWRKHCSTLAGGASSFGGAVFIGRNSSTPVRSSRARAAGQERACLAGDSCQIVLPSSVRAPSSPASTLGTAAKQRAAKEDQIHRT